MTTKTEMWERACEQGFATLRGDEYEWLPGCGPGDVDWDCERVEEGDDDAN